MEVLKIKGGVPLKGQVKAAGAKNAVTKLLVASLLSDKRCRFYNVPDIGDVASDGRPLQRNRHGSAMG